MALALLGAADALYLTIHHLTGQSVRCTVTGGCSQVLASSYAKIGGVPTAAFGVLAYFAVFSLATLAVFGYRWARTAMALVVASMLAVTCWLLYVQAFVLHAFCQYCLLSALLTIALSALTHAARFIRDAPSKNG